MYEWSNIDSETVCSWIEPSLEEMQALQDLELINNNEEPAECSDVNEDHWTYINIYQYALNTKAKYDAIEKRRQLYIQS